MRTARLVVAVAAVLMMCAEVGAQSCPNDSTLGEAPASSTLHGTVVYHDELRHWLGLKLDKQTCGENEIQLVFVDPKNWRQTEALRGCKATVIGALYEAPTGYYSASLAVTDPAIATDADCKPYAVKTDPALAPMKSNLNKFFAEILVDYRKAGRVRVRVWEDESRKSELTPWQAYLHYELTGGRDVMWFGCASGFEIRNLVQRPNPEGEPTIEPNVAMTVLPSESLNRVSFECARQSDDKATKQRNGK